MTTDIIQDEQLVDATADLSTLPDAEIVVTQPAESYPAGADWESIKAKAVNFISNFFTHSTNFFSHNRRLFSLLGWLFAAFVGIRVLVAVAATLNGIPLLGGFLELVGLFYTIWFSYRYLIRVSDRQELSSVLNQAKADIFGG